MVLKIEGEINSITEISSKQFNQTQINSIKYSYKELRQESKAPTFALTR